jgi:hypothetical protein
MIVCFHPNGLSAIYVKRFITRHLADQGGFATLTTLERATKRGLNDKS